MQFLLFRLNCLQSRNEYVIVVIVVLSSFILTLSLRSHTFLTKEYIIACSTAITVIVWMVMSKCFSLVKFAVASVPLTASPENLYRVLFCRHKLVFSEELV